MNAIRNSGRTRMAATDIGLAVFFGLLCSATTVGADPQHSPPAGAFALIWVCAAALAARRPLPEVALFVPMIVLGAYLALDYPEGPVYFLPAVGVYYYAYTRPPRIALAVFAGLFAAYTLVHTYVLQDGDDLWVNATVTLLWLAVPAGVGMVVREAVRARSREREAERERHRADERVAMAREIHDVVGHSLAVVSMNAGVALHVLDKRPDAAPGVVDNLRAIRDTSTRALDDLRATLRPLREGEAPELRPAFDLDDVPALVDDVRKGGLQVAYEATGEAADVPPGVAATAYRVVQEALTNVIRHAGARSATVRIAAEPGTMTIEITDDGRGGAAAPGGPGQGITGMTERVESRGGTFHAGPAPGGGFRVHAELPHSSN